MDYNTTERMMLNVAKMTDTDFQSYLLTTFPGDDFWNSSARDMLIHLREVGQRGLIEVDGFRIEIEQHGKLSNLTGDHYRKVYAGRVHFSDRVVPVEIISNTYSYQTISDTIKSTLSFADGFKAGFVEPGNINIHSYVADLPEEHAFEIYEMLTDIYKQRKDLDVANYIEMEEVERQKSLKAPIKALARKIAKDTPDNFIDKFRDFATFASEESDTMGFVESGTDLTADSFNSAKTEEIVTLLLLNRIKEFAKNSQAEDNKN
ncbi:hypothetical protein [Paraburkholderia aromaticivorans]|uniref:hypothetical protein n=1 Tax=Paraburkholderia aromaticivorans TaxID=2026199 RepID=UPI0038B973C9